MKDRIKAMEDALRQINGITEASIHGANSGLDVAEVQRIAGAALVASQPAQPVAQLNGRSYRKKPVVIEAVQWTGENLREVIAFTDGPPETKSRHAGMMWEHYEDLVRKDGLKIYTLEGKMDASLGDWIIKGVKGEFYPCKPDIFAATYEPASQPITAQPALSVAVKVKPLVWFEVYRNRVGGKYTAEGYMIRWIEGLWLLHFAGDSKAAWRFIDLESAKAAAQADYEARIMAALDVQPITAQDAARVLLTALERAPTDIEILKLLLNGQPFAAMRAIVEKE